MFQRKQIVGYILLIHLCSRVQMQLYTALNDITPLIKTQGNVIASLTDYIQHEERRLNILNQHLKIYELEHKKAIKDVFKYVQNPINSYSLIRRLTKDLKFIETKIRKKTEFIKDEKLIYPTDDDLDGALEALLRLQSTYRLNITQLAEGTINGTNGQNQKSFVEKVTPVNTRDCYELGVKAYMKDGYRESIAWLTEALAKYKEKDSHIYNITEKEILRTICNSFSALGEEDDIDWCAMMWSPRPKRYPNMIKRNREMLSQAAARHEKHEKDIILKTLITSQDHRENVIFNSLCRGEKVIGKSTSDNLICYYATGPHPLLRLAPIKTEQLHLSPEILLFHNAISDAEILHVQNQAKTKLKRAKITGPRYSGESNIRVCKVAVLDNRYQVSKRVLLRMSDVTGLDLTSTEKLPDVELQVTNYGIGGHCVPHEDFSAKLPRVATIIFFLSDVALGGATAFIDLGVTVRPRRGSALFWRNLRSPASWSNCTRHGACPVLHGSKWGEFGPVFCATNEPLDTLKMRSYFHTSLNVECF